METHILKNTDRGDPAIAKFSTGCSAFSFTILLCSLFYKVFIKKEFSDNKNREQATGIWIDNNSEQNPLRNSQVGLM